MLRNMLRMFYRLGLPSHPENNEKPTINRLDFGRAPNLLLTICLALLAGQASAMPPTSFFRPGVPDFDQLNAGFPNGGNNHCAPTAAANSFTWFDNNGFDIVPDGSKDTPTMPNNHNNLINQLAMDVMTSGANGTKRDDYVKGLRKYLRGPSNQSGHQFDVKFQGTGYNGYTVGSQGNTATLDFLKTELTMDEDVMLHIGWFTETSPGVLSARQGGHVVTLDGYTANNSLLIRDPFYAEGIIEMDSSFPAADMIFEYSTATPNLRAKIEGITTVSPKPILFDGIIVPSEYQLVGVNINPTLQLVTLSTFSDYVSFGLDHTSLAGQVISPGNPAQVTIVDTTTQRGFHLTYDSFNGLTNVQEGVQTLTGFNPTGPFDNTDLWFQLAHAVAPSSAEAIPHPQAELHIDREVFGSFAVDSFFEVFVDIELGGDGFGFELNPQSLSDLIPIDDVTDPFDPYPAIGSIGDEIFRREAAIASIIPEPGVLSMLVCIGLLVVGKRRMTLPMT